MTPLTLILATPGALFSESVRMRFVSDLSTLPMVTVPPIASIVPGVPVIKIVPTHVTVPPGVCETNCPPLFSVRNSLVMLVPFVSTSFAPAFTTVPLAAVLLPNPSEELLPTVL